MTVVPAGTEEISIEKDIKESISNAKEMLNRVVAAPVNKPQESRKVYETNDRPDSSPCVRSESDKTFYIHKCHANRRSITTPAGLPPVKPAGYKQKNWPNGPASDEVVQNWALEVYHSDDERYRVDAVIYWARYFWDINGPEFPRIKTLIEEVCKSSF